MSASEHIETNRRIEREERERTDRGGGAVWPGSGTNRLGAAALSAHAGDSVPVVDSMAGEAGSSTDYTRDDTQPGLKLVADPADGTAENYATLEFTSDGGSPEQRDGLQVRFDPDGFEASSDGLTLASGITLPAGAIIMWGGGAAPGSWLLCDGSAVSRTTYADLFSAIGTSYGVGDGSTTFNLPDFGSKFARGNETGAGGGDDTHDHAIDDQTQEGGGSHGHGLYMTGPSSTTDVSTGGTAVASASHEHPGEAVSTDINHDHIIDLDTDEGDNVPSYTGVKFIIKT